MSASGFTLNGMPVATGNYQQEQRGKQRESESDASNLKGRDGEFDYSYALGKGADFAYPDESEEEEEEEEAMPAEFYQNVNTFLSKGPPRLKKGKASAPSSATAVRPTAGNVPKGGAAPTAGKKKAISSSSATGARRGDIDENLLRDAFAYTDRILREAVLEEQDRGDRGGGKQGGPDRGPERGQDRGPTPPFSSSYVPARKGSEGGGSGVVQKLRSKTQALSSTGSAYRASSKAHSSGYGGGSSTVFNVSSAGLEEEGDRKGAFDINNLVSNFETGATLRRLQEELAASRESMGRSRDAIQSISDSYLRGDLGRGR